MLNVRNSNSKCDRFVVAIESLNSLAMTFRAVAEYFFVFPMKTTSFKCVRSEH